MRKSIVTFSMIALLALAACAGKPTSDLEKGIAAYENKDYATAEREIRPWAEYGDPRAQLYLARVVIKLPHSPSDAGVRKVDGEMVKWLRKAAESDYEPAQIELARMQVFVPMMVSEAEALKWYRKSADHGNPEALTVLGSWYERAPRSDRVTSYALYKVAAKTIKESGADTSIRTGQYLDKLTARMSPQEIEAGEALAGRIDAPGAVLSKVIEKKQE